MPKMLGAKPGATSLLLIVDNFDSRTIELRSSQFLFQILERVTRFEILLEQHEQSRRTTRHEFC